MAGQKLTSVDDDTQVWRSIRILHLPCLHGHLEFCARSRTYIEARSKYSGTLRIGAVAYRGTPPEIFS